LLLEGGMRLTPSVSTGADLTFRNARALPAGALEIAYACR
jgi:hypothetical protein